MTLFNNRWKDFTDISQLTHTYAQTETILDLLKM